MSHILVRLFGFVFAVVQEAGQNVFMLLTHCVSPGIRSELSYNRDDADAVFLCLSGFSVKNYKHERDAETQFRFDTLQLLASNRTRLAEVLVDFARDLHGESGIWSALEKYNTDLFGTPLPPIQPVGKVLPPGICKERVQFLLWNLYTEAG